MVLDQYRGKGSRAMDATDWQNMGTACLRDTACALHSHQEAHPQSGKVSMLALSLVTSHVVKLCMLVLSVQIPN